MFKWDELDDLKKAALNWADSTEEPIERRSYNATMVLVYQNEQIIRELRSIGWKLKEINDRGAL